MPQGTQKKSCRCGHGKSIHQTQRVTVRNKGVFRSPCNHPNCKCRDYRPTK